VSAVFSAGVVGEHSYESKFDFINTALVTLSDWRILSFGCGAGIGLELSGDRGRGGCAPDTGGADFEGMARGLDEFTGAHHSGQLIEPVDSHTIIAVIRIERLDSNRLPRDRQ
jgi:hypothetical protein